MQIWCRQKPPPCVQSGSIQREVLAFAAHGFEQELPGRQLSQRRVSHSLAKEPRRSLVRFEFKWAGFSVC